MELPSTFEHRFSKKPAIVARAPGRVNLLGEHVDYNDGMVLPVALDLAVYIAALPVGDRTVTLVAADLHQEVQFSLDDLDSKQDLQGRELPGWAKYPAGVAWALQKEGLAVGGMQAVFSSELPIGSGLSSSAAVEVGFSIVWRAMGGWPADGLRLAQICQRAENIYVGVNCGLMDQFASACGVDGHALYFDTRSLEWCALPLPPETAIIIADSGVRRSLANSAYNERRVACETAVELLRQYLPKIRSLRDVTPAEFAAYGYYLPQPVQRRAEHIVKEIARVESAVQALKRADGRAFGALMYAGHNSLRDLFEVSIPELDVLVEISRGLPGCLGARLTGAGFGGCTVHLVQAQQASDFIDGLIREYARRTGRQAQVYLCRASAGAAIVDSERSGS